MKEKDENSHSDDSYTGKLDLTNNRIDVFRQILDSKDNITIHIIKPNDIYINIKNTSYLKIVSMSQIYPEDFLLFFNKEQRLYTPRELSLNFSNNSAISNKELDFSSTPIKFPSSDKKSKEEIINNEKYNNIKHSEENIDNIKIENEIMMNNIKNIQLLSLNSNNDNNIIKKEKKEIKMVKTSADKKLVLFKWIYHFYIILSIIILIHYFSFIFSEFNNSLFYKLISVVLIISLCIVGYIGIKYKYSKPPFFIFNDKYLFWIHFFILILTILTFDAMLSVGGHFIFIKSQGILGYIILIIYILSLIIEGYYVLYYDVIIEEINWDRNNNRMNVINEYTDNYLNIQLTEM